MSVLKDDEKHICEVFRKAPNAPSAGNVSGPPGAMKNHWGSRTPSGSGASGYGSNAANGITGPWNVPGDAGVSRSMGQPPSAATGYGSRGFGFTTKIFPERT